MSDENKISRREFIKGAAVAGAAVAGAGVVASSVQAQTQCPPCPVPGVPEKWDKEADVVVVGAGGAGYCAAITAADAGSEVIILEKLPTTGGATAICAGSSLVPNTKYQKQQGITDSPDNYYKEVVAARLYDPSLARVMADEAGPTFDWMMEELGLRVRQITPIRSHQMVGKLGSEFLRVFTEAVAKRPKISILLEAPAVGLFFHPVTKEVFGVEAQGKPGKISVKARKAVVLATGGYNSNGAFIEKHFPDYPASTIMNYGHLGNTGDGITMGQMVGADLLHVYPRANPWIIKTGPGRGDFFSWPTLITSGGIIVNKVCKRFVEEITQSNYAVLLPIVLKQPEAALFWIWDAAMLTAARQAYTQAQTIDQFEGYFKGGEIKSGATVEALAKELGLDPTPLKATIDAYNKNVAAGKDPEFGRKESLKSIEVAPFYGLRTYVGFGSTYGGLRIDTKAHVLDAKGKVIPRLYAAGETAAITWDPVGYKGGSFTIRAFTFGRIAGKNAVAEKSWGAV